MIEFSASTDPPPLSSPSVPETPFAFTLLGDNNFVHAIRFMNKLVGVVFFFFVFFLG